jgi:mannosyltransferase OCH1-like enzyme
MTGGAVPVIPKILHQTAKTKVLTWEERQLIDRAKRLLPGWQFRLWDDAENSQLVAEHFPEHFAAFQHIPRGVMKADVARLVYMHAFGGVYMDTDYKLFTGFDDRFLSASCIFGVERGRFEAAGQELTTSDDVKFGNAFFAAQRGHPFFSAMINRIFEKAPFDNLSDWELMTTSGPQGLSRFLLDNLSAYKDIEIRNQSVFYPDSRFTGLSNHVNDDTIGAHLCWGSWRSKRRAVTIKNRARRIVSALL